MANAYEPREGTEPTNADNIRIQKSGTGSVHTAVGDSHFYSKYGIKPITDSIEGGQHVAEQDSPIKMKNVRKLHEGSTKFPKLEECAHFHYDYVEIKTIKAGLSAENQENIKSGSAVTSSEYHFYIQVVSNDNKTWIVRRSFDNFRNFDKQLHRCIFDRKYSLLPEVRTNDFNPDNIQVVREALALYLQRFSSIAGNMINCGPVLSWLEMDNRGNRLLVTDDSSAINTPAVSAGHVIKRYQSQDPDELSLQVGDIISIIDMPRADETIWWRGKKGFEVGFFPCECIEIIGDKIPQGMESKIAETPFKPVLRKRGKLITFLRAFFTSRPARTQLKRSGIVKERVFGCDLGEHLLNSKQDVPLILKNCTAVIEEHGIVDGIYRLSGVASNIQKLRNDFDEEKVPDLCDDIYLQDIHSISSLLKAYFRELPNPLLTYQLYDKFSAAVHNHDNKLLKIHDVIQQLPPPHYRTAEFLFRHLNGVSKHGAKTGMHCKNIAIVWAPNLMRSKELDKETDMGCTTAMLQGVGVQAIVTEFLIQYTDLIFSDKLQNFSDDKDTAGIRRSRPKSLAISTPTKLLSLEEAREHILAGQSNNSPKQKFIEVGGGPASLPAEYHTVIELPNKKKSRKSRKSPSVSSAVPSTTAANAGSGSSWRNLFSRGSKNLKKQDSTSEDTLLGAHCTAEDKSKLRAVHSVESLASVASSTQSRLSDFNDDVFRLAGDDFTNAKTKSSTFDRPKNKKAKKSSRRSLSADLSQSESDFSEMDEGLTVTMETDVHAQSEFINELEEKVSKKTKSSKDSKRSKKKSHARSSSDGPLATDLFGSLRDRSPRTQSDRAGAQDCVLLQETSEDMHAGNQSPSIKERLVHALTPTSPRKKIKGPAPSPPRSPTVVSNLPPPAKSKKKSSKKSKSAKSAAEVNQSDQVVSEGQENLIGSEVASTVQLSPIEEALHSDMSNTPDAQNRIAVSRPGIEVRHESQGFSHLDIIPPQENGSLSVGRSEFYDTLQSDRSDMTDVTLTNSEMSMSLDSLLREVSGSDTYHSASDSNAQFGTFGKRTNEIEGPAPPVPKPRASKRVGDNRESWNSTSETERVRTPSTNSVLETDMDSFDLHIKTDELTQETSPVRSPRRGAHTSDDVTPGEDEERFNYVAPLPGDVKMMSHFPDLIAPNLMSQIELEDSDVQYVDPYQMQDLDTMGDNGRFVGFSGPSEEHSLHQNDAVSVEAQSTVSDHDLVIDLPKVDWQTPEPMMTSPGAGAQYMASADQAVPDVIGVNAQEIMFLEHKTEVTAKPAQIVIQKPAEDVLEMSTFLSTKCRVVPPPKQFAYMAPPTVATLVDEEGIETNLDEIESPLEDFPSPPPPEAFLEHSSKTSVPTRINLTDGYIADRSSSASPIIIDKDQFQEQLKAISQPVVIEEQEVSMATSPVSKTPDSDIAMVTSSVESDHLILDDTHKVYRVDTQVEKSIDINDRNEIPESNGMVFQMDDITMKSSDSLHNISMSSDEHLLNEKDNINETTETKDSKDNDFFFFMENANDEVDVRSNQKVTFHPSENVESHSFSDVKAARKLPTEALAEESQSNRKPTPVKRKKSVKELLSRFETSNSPPSDSGAREVKVKPAVFQKPKLVRMHSLTKSNEFDDIEETVKPEVTSHVNIMSTSCPDVGGIFSLSPRSIDMDYETSPDLETSNLSHAINLEQDTTVQSTKKPSVKNKIQQFESTASAEVQLSENEMSASRSDRSPQRPERSPHRPERSPTRLIPERSKSPPLMVSPRSLSPAKEVIIHERKASKSGVDEVPMKATENRSVFPAAKASQQSPQLSRKSRSSIPNQDSTPGARSSFKMRSASSTGSTPLVTVLPDKEPSTQESLSERVKRFESFKIPTEDWKVSDSQTSPKAEILFRSPKSLFESNPEMVEVTQPNAIKSTMLPNSKASTLDKKKPVVPAKDYQRSASVPQTTEPQLQRKTVDTQSNVVAVSNDTEDESNGVLKPSELFSRRSKRLSGPPPPVAHKTVTVKAKHDNEQDIMVSSFSDRRKLFESSTDSGISSNHGSLKRSEIYMKPKQQSVDLPVKSPAVVHKDIELSHSKTSQSDSDKHCVNIDSKTELKSRTEQKENVKPNVTLKSFERDTGLPEHERSGSVKDLWRKFEHNTNI